MWFNLSDRTQLELTGKDRAKFLHGFCTNDIKGLTPGQGCEAFVCNIQGKTLGHIFVFCTETSLWIDSVSGQEDVLFAHLDRYLINEDVQIHRRSADSAEFYLQGNLDELSLPRDAIRDFSNPRPLAHWEIPIEHGIMQLRSVDWLGSPGWLISTSRTSNIQQQFPVVATDASVWHALRIEAGFPLFGIDFTAEYLAQEVNRTSRAISFHKGCYLGQEPIARIDALGHVNRELRRLQFSGTEVPISGTELFDPATNTPVGRITSSERSVNNPELIVAIGTLRSKYCQSGCEVAFAALTGSVMATVR